MEEGRLTDYDVDLQMTDSAFCFLIDKGFHEDYGACPLRRPIECYIADPLAEYLLRGEFETGKTWVEKQGEGDEAKLGFSATEPAPEPEPVQAT